MFKLLLTFITCLFAFKVANPEFADSNDLPDTHQKDSEKYNTVSSELTAPLGMKAKT